MDNIKRTPSRVRNASQADFAFQISLLNLMNLGAKAPLPADGFERLMFIDRALLSAAIPTA